MLLNNRGKEASSKMNMTLSQAKAENTSPVTGVMPRTEKSYLERDVQMNTKTKLNRKREKNLHQTFKNNKGSTGFKKVHRKMLMHMYHTK